MKLWKQIRKIEIEGKIFEGLDIEFQVQRKDDNNSDIAVVGIYNLSDETKGYILKDKIISIVAGYRELNGVIFNGKIDDVTHVRDGSDILTKMICTPNNNLYTSTKINIQFKAGIKPSEILQQLKGKIPFNIDVKELVKDNPYPNGKAFSNRLSNVVGIIARDTGTIARFDNETIEFKAPNKSYTKTIKIGSEQGLIRIDKMQKREKETQKYQMETLLIPLLKIGQLVEVDSMSHKGQFIVKTVEFNAQDINVFSAVSVMEVAK